MFPPERIVCLTEETVETLYLLCGISGYVVRSPRARRENPRVSAFMTADVPKILNLKPEIVTFSDLQADIAATLIRESPRSRGTDGQARAPIYRTQFQRGKEMEIRSKVIAAIAGSRSTWLKAAAA
jgi:iron complex transport system substrate-binding protein